MDDFQFRRLLDRFGFSWAGYAKVRKGVKKRLARHMQEMACQNMGDYIQAVESDAQVRLQFERLMTVSISRFFRDRRLWQSMQGEVLPILAKAPHSLKVWSAGCASGEEVYSFKMLWVDMQESFASLPDLNILATDLCPQYLERARAAVYPPSSLREVPETIRSAYFEIIEKGKYAVRSWVKTGIAWQVHDLLSGAPGTSFDLIFLRNNLLTYYTDQAKIPSVLRVVDSLAQGGFLVIGSHERMPVETSDLERWEDTKYVFRKGH